MTAESLLNHSFNNNNITRNLKIVYLVVYVIGYL